MKMHVGNMTETALDYAVSVCEGLEYYTEDPFRFSVAWLNYEFRHSSSWSRAGPIIEREGISIKNYGMEWEASVYDGEWFVSDSPLISAMRCYVASKLGVEVEIPDDLVIWHER